jgi:RHS repeat-associated protein
VYLSYDNDSNNWVYFDDFKVTHTKSNVIQYNEYYPFGLQTASSWTRENTTGNNFLYNEGTELNPASSLYDLEYRNYDPILGRMHQVDPMVDKYSSLTPYNYAFNDPVAFNDPSGADPWEVKHHPNKHKVIDYSGTASVAPGSGNNWADQYRDVAGNMMLMSTNTFRDFYGLDDGYGGTNYERAGQLANNLAASGSVGSDGPLIYNYFCACMVNAFDVLATDPTNQNKNFRAWAQVAADIYNTRAQLYNGIAEDQVLLAGFGFAESANIASYMIGTSETFNSLYYMNKVRNTLYNDPRFKLQNAFKGNFKGYSKNVTAVFNEYRIMTAAGKALGKTMFGVGLVLTAHDIHKNNYSASSIAWGVADTSVAAAALLLASNPVGWVVGAGAAVYFTGRFAYSLYDAYKEGD